MFKTDSKSLEELSFDLNEQDIAQLARLFDLLKTKDLLTISDPELERVRQSFAAISSLKLNGKIYGFHVEDDYAYRQSSDAGYGVELWLRQGHRLEEYLANPDRDWVLKIDEVAPTLLKRNIKTIYTGNFPGAYFLNLPQNSDPDDPLERSGLSESEVEEFRRAGIEVVVLDTLL